MESYRYISSYVYVTINVTFINIPQFSLLRKCGSVINFYAEKEAIIIGGHIQRALKKICHEQNYTRFHMPGHKGRNRYDLDLYPYDFTEIPGTDNLICPEESIKRALEEIADTYGVLKSFMLVNGSTVGILASILSVCHKGDCFLIPRDSHKSVYSAIILGEINPVYLYAHQEGNEYPVITAKQVEEAFITYPNAKGVIITSPTYYGVCLDVKSISQVAKKYHKVLIVDEAHGAHLKFNEDYPSSSVDLGADIVIQSTHKTLNSLNQGALLHVCSSKVNPSHLQYYINMLQTSSPSYPIMISIEEAVLEARNVGKEKLDELLSYYQLVEGALRRTPFSLAGTKLIGQGKIYDYDRIKLWIETPKVSGIHLSQVLREKYHVQMELWDRKSILALMGMGTERVDVERLIFALKECSEWIDDDDMQKEVVYSYPKVEMQVSPWEAVGREREQIPLLKSLGRICADFILPYPPGVPVLVPGEIVDKNILAFLEYWNEKDIMGLTDNRIWVLRE